MPGTFSSRVPDEEKEEADSCLNQFPGHDDTSADDTSTW